MGKISALPLNQETDPGLGVQAEEAGKQEGVPPFISRGIEVGAETDVIVRKKSVASRAHSAHALQAGLRRPKSHKLGVCAEPVSEPNKHSALSRFATYAGEVPGSSDVLYEFYVVGAQGVPDKKPSSAFGVDLVLVGTIEIPASLSDDMRRVVQCVPELGGRLGHITCGIQKSANKCVATSLAYFPKQTLSFCENGAIRATGLGALLDTMVCSDLVERKGVTHINPGNATLERIRQLHKAGLEVGDIPVARYAQGLEAFATARL